MSKQNLIRRNPASKIREFADRLLDPVRPRRPVLDVHEPIHGQARQRDAGGQISLRGALGAICLATIAM